MAVEEPDFCLGCWVNIQCFRLSNKTGDFFENFDFHKRISFEILSQRPCRFAMFTLFNRLTLFSQGQLFSQNSMLLLGWPLISLEFY